MKLNEVQSKLVEDNMNIVYKVLNDMGVIIDDDYIQEGMYNLCYAAATYNPNKTKFSTYAYAIVKCGLKDGLSKDNVYGKYVPIECPSVVSMDNFDEEVLGSSDDLHSIERTLMIKELWEKSTPTNQLILKMIYLGYTQEEIAKSIHKTQSFVSVSLTRIRNNLEEQQWQM